jgi:uncharacterized protein
LDLSRLFVAGVRGDGLSDDLAVAAWSLLTELDAGAPEAVDGVMAHPYTRAWAVRCMEGAGGPPAADTGGFAEIAAAAAIRAGWETEVRVPVRDGMLRLPSVGALRLGGVPEALVTTYPDGFAVKAEGRTVRVGGGMAAGPRWQPVRRLSLPDTGVGRWEVALEDTDPQRDSHQYALAGRLPDDATRAWVRDLNEAWHLIGSALPQYGEGVAVGLGTITPLRPVEQNRSISSAARQAFGAVGIARPPRPELLALLLVHEFQHVKLGAVLDLYELFDREDTRLFYAPWRPDPRPLEAFFQGTYAHLAVAEFWRSRLLDHHEAGASSEEVAHAEREFALWRSHTAEAVATLTDSGALTELGKRFAVGMATTVAPWLEEPVARGAVVSARRSAEATRSKWMAKQGAEWGAGG